MTVCGISLPRPALGEWTRRPLLWIGAGAALTIALRAPYADAGLTRDEGGDLFIAQAFGHAGPYAYGAYFVDRPPLLLAAYRLASLVAGSAGVRVMGMLAAVALVALIVVLATRLAGPAAAPFASLAAATMLSSQAAGAVVTPAELLAAVPSCGSVLLLVSGLQRGDRAWWRFAAAGAAAALAIFVKQSFGDALLAGAAGLAAGLWARPSDWRLMLARAEAFTAGLAAALAALVTWAVLVHGTAHQLWYAVFGFRLDAARVLVHGQAARALRLSGPLLFSGLAVALPVTAAVWWRMKGSPGLRAALAIWLLAGIAGVLAGGNYAPAYVIELMPVAAVGLAVACVRRPRAGTVALLAVLGVGLLPTLRGAVHDSADAYGQQARTLGLYVRGRAEPGQTIYVMYARANVLYYAGLPSPFPYHWALMMQAIPGARDQLRGVLAGPSRPTWIVAQDSPGGYGLDPDGRTRALLARHYRVVAHVCGTAVLLARGAPAKAPPRALGPCG